MHHWKQIPYFLSVARTGGFRPAADDLDATHATVRSHIIALENSLGTQLFRRSKKGLELTRAGRILLTNAQDAEKQLETGRNGVQGVDRQASGLVRISAEPMTGHLLLAPILAEFCKLYPDIELEIRLTYDIEDINGLETDISIRNAEAVSDDVTARKLFPTASCIYASRDYIDTHFPGAGARGENLQWIGYGAEPEQKIWVDQSPFPDARLRHIARDVEMHLHLVRGGLGMSFLPVWCETLFPELRRAPGTDIVFRRNTWILLHSDLRKVARIRMFVDFVAQALRNVNAQLTQQRNR
ncbi:LysR family transcriptional regulator [Maricaulis maris]|uniref:DNA-binding transcriptional LysR family regulator n=1 Tax=Maricaulis maris TaxID=74318 RepID=A0A495CW28_9PROT|nr:LysR family transcriptional regulator [Maricaulis maris]RKQ89579.1 DNA-binding transcriptional LysR family regulator [Maricaulis maris]